MFGIIGRAIKKNMQKYVIILLPLFSKQFFIRAERTTDVFGFCKHCNLSSNWSVQEVKSLPLIADHIRKRESQPEVIGKKQGEEKNERKKKEKYEKILQVC